MYKRVILFFILISNTAISYSFASNFPDGFVELNTYIPTVKLEIRYYTTENFVGERIDGYESPKAILTLQAADALKNVQKELLKFKLGLKVFDAYRPQLAVDHFARWAKDLNNIKMKNYYYPEINKVVLFINGYIADKSGHSRGSTVDVTIVSLHDENSVELDMGTNWDFFSPKSWPSSSDVTVQQRANRMLLQNVMSKHGFKPLKEEWWHFTLKHEPYPNHYFNFPIE
ncbi:MAG: M15 family metallopeptidase [Gammaproteobacteria bacterium]